MNILATFKSRNQAILFSNVLSSAKISNRLINTPRFLSLSCGLSVQFDVRGISYAKEILQGLSYDSLGGLYAINRNGTFDSINIK